MSDRLHFGVDVLVDGRPLRQHQGEHGKYVLSRAGVKYQIELTCRGPPDGAAMAEVFVDGHTVFLGPSHTRKLRRRLLVPGFEKRRIVRQLEPDEADVADADQKMAYEHANFVFAFPVVLENRADPDLGSIRVELYEPLPIDVKNRQRRPAGMIRNSTMQPRQGKKEHVLDGRLTTKEGDLEQTAFFALTNNTDFHTVYTKGDHLYTLNLRYYQGEDQYHYRGGSSSRGPGAIDLYRGPGNRLGSGAAGVGRSRLLDFGGGGARHEEQGGSLAIEDGHLAIEDGPLALNNANEQPSADDDAYLQAAIRASLEGGPDEDAELAAAIQASTAASRAEEDDFLMAVQMSMHSGAEDESFDVQLAALAISSTEYATGAMSSGASSCQNPGTVSGGDRAGPSGAQCSRASAEESRAVENSDLRTCTSGVDTSRVDVLPPSLPPPPLARNLPGSAPTLPEATASEVELSVGSPVEVHWYGQWYPAVIMQPVDQATGNVRVMFLGSHKSTHRRVLPTGTVEFFPGDEQGEVEARDLRPRFEISTPRSDAGLQ